jgi:hypothetical protein
MAGRDHMATIVAPDHVRDDFPDHIGADNVALLVQHILWNSDG